jgi:phosphoesterase RecJ-like protein
MRKSPELIAYKGELLQRVEYFADGRIAVIHIPWPEIERYSHAYNPSMLVMDDMRFTTGVDVAIAFKTYKDDKITAKIRCNYNKAIGGDLAKRFGGGGHPYASGFKIDDGRSYADIKKECIETATNMLNELPKTSE